MVNKFVSVHHSMCADKHIVVSVKFGPWKFHYNVFCGEKADGGKFHYDWTQGCKFGKWHGWDKNA